MVASDNGKTSVEPIVDLITKSTTGKFFLFPKTLTTRFQKIMIIEAFRIPNS